MKINFKRNFKLVDNGDLTQNLHSLCYQNNILISEADLGNVEDILVQLKKQKEIIDKTKKLIKQYGKYDGQKCTRGFQMWIADFNKLLQLLEDKEETDINVGEV